MGQSEIAAMGEHTVWLEDATQRSEYLEQRWYAAYTSANHEKRVAKQLGQREVEHFLPMYQSARRWKDRQVVLSLPLFPGYVFVRLALRDRLQVLTVPGVARLVGFNGPATPLADEEIESLRRALTDGLRAEPHPYLKVGRRVRITTGLLSGHEGILKRWKGGLRVVLTIELIERSISVEVDSSSVTPVHQNKLPNASSQH